MKQAETSAGFTPGPWAINPLLARVDCRAFSKKGGLLPVCQMLWPTDERSEAETEANARLIAAAPELYEALDDVLIHCLADIDLEEQKDAPDEATLTIFRARRDRAQAALAKAGGSR